MRYSHKVLLGAVGFWVFIICMMFWTGMTLACICIGIPVIILGRVLWDAHQAVKEHKNK